MAHYLGEGWSERNQIPTVQQYEAEMRKRDGEEESSTFSDFFSRWTRPSENKTDGVPSETGSNLPAYATRHNNGPYGGEDDEAPAKSGMQQSVSGAGVSQQSQAAKPLNADSFKGTPTNLNQYGSSLSAQPSTGSAQPPIRLSSQQSGAGSDAQSQLSRTQSQFSGAQSQYSGAQSQASGGKASGASGAESGKGPDVPPKEKKKKEVVSDAGGGEEEKQRIKEAAENSKKKTTNQFTAKGERVVDDPITGRDVVIRDGKGKSDIDPKHLDARCPGGYSTHELGPNDEQRELHTTPHPVTPSNVLLRTYPEPANVEGLSQLKESFDKLSMYLIGAVVCVWAISAFGRGWVAFFMRTLVLGGVGLGAYMAVGLAYNKIARQFEHVRAQMHKQRGAQYSPPMPESVEWLNAAIACVWKQMNPEMFVSMLDMVEDIMQSSLPGFIQSVKVSDFDLGENPFRLIAMRGLADIMTDPEYPRRTWIEHSEGQSEGQPQEDKEDETEGLTGEAGEEVKKAKEDDEAGDFLNMEVSFCYSALSGESSKDRSKNIHMLVEFFLGAFDWIEIPLPIWVQVEHITGTVRVRAQITSEPPFLRNLTFSLMGVPSVHISAIPMLRALPNVLDLPLISNFVQSSIAAACNMYVAPKSMTMNMTQMLSGDGVKKDTDALGVLMVNIKYGQDLSSQDVNGESDPYCVLSFAKFGRPLYATRIIFEDLNPVWEETAFLLVTRDDLRSGESLSLQLWDSDKRSADDIVGRVNVPLRDLVRNPNKLQSHLSDLMGFEDADQMQGQLSWSAGFFEKAKLNKELSTAKDDKDESQTEKEIERKPSPIDSEEEAASLHVPPERKWPCGVLSVIVKHINGLENREVEKGVSTSDREGTAGQDVEENLGGLPSSYCELILNDNLLFKTRVKQYSNMPFFNAGTEIFVRDWTEAELRVIVRDARLREHDPIMGIVSLPLTEVFKESSQVDQQFSLQDGVGYGKVSLSLVFKAVRLSIPRELRGFNTVSVDILSNIEIESGSESWKSKLADLKLSITAGLWSKKLSSLSKLAHLTEDEPLISVPVFDRYSTLVSFDFGRLPIPGMSGITKPIPGVNKPNAVAVLPLRDLEDGQVTDVVLPVLHASNVHALERNYIDHQTKKTHDFEEVATISMRLRVNAGLSEAHREIATGPRDRHEFEVYERLVGLPQRAEENSHADDDGIISRKERRAINKTQTQQLHMRHRGAMGYTPVRMAKWAKDGFKDHVKQLGGAVIGKEKRTYPDSPRRPIYFVRIVVHSANLWRCKWRRTAHCHHVLAQEGGQAQARCGGGLAPAAPECTPR